MAANSKRSWKLQEFMAHGANVNCLALGHNSGRVLVTGGDDKKVNLWAIGKQNCLRSLSGHTTPVECVKFGHTEVTVCAGSQAGVLKLWDLEAAKLFRTLAGHKAGIKCIDFHPYHDFLASGSLDKSIKLWDNRSKFCIFTYKGHEESVNSIKFSPDGQWIASGGEEGKVKIWDIRIGRVLKELDEHSGAVTDVEFHPIEFLLASSSADRSVNFWDLEHFHLVSKTEKETSPIKCLHFSVKGKCLFGGCDEQLKVYGWEPARIFDTVTIGWGKVQDMATAQDQLIGASFYLTNVLVCIVDTKKVSHFGAPASRASQMSPFAHGQAVRKSFNKQRPKESKPKAEVKPIEEEYDTEYEPSISIIPNIDNYEEIFKPHRSLNHSPPPLYTFSDLTSEDDVSVSSITANSMTKRSNLFVYDDSESPVSSVPVSSSQTLMSPEQRVPSPSSVQNVKSSKSYQSLSCTSQNTSQSTQNNLSKSVKSPVTSSQYTVGNVSKSTIKSETSRKPNSYKNDSEFDSSANSSENNYSRNESLSNVTRIRKVSAVNNYKSRVYNKQTNDTHSYDTDSVVPYIEDNKSSSENQDELIPSHCETAIDLRLEEFLPVSYRNGSKCNQSYSNLSESEIISSLTRNHEMVLTILKIRQRNLQIIYSLWHRQDLKCALEGAVSMNDEAVLIDVLSAISKRPALWNLDVCVVLLPAIYNLLHSKYEMHMSVCCDSLKLILKNFSSVIKTNVQWSSPTIGVDISKEERYTKCVKCYDNLTSIRTFLLKRQTMQGKVGQSFREIQSLLYAIEK